MKILNKCGIFKDKLSESEYNKIIDGGRELICVNDDKKVNSYYVILIYRINNYGNYDTEYVEEFRVGNNFPNDEQILFYLSRAEMEYGRVCCSIEKRYEATEMD